MLCAVSSPSVRASSAGPLKISSAQPISISGSTSQT